MKKTNILIVGDYRDCLNYGAIATTECLLKMFAPFSSKAEFKYVTYRSFMRRTPKEGWNTSSDDHLKDRLSTSKTKKILKRALYKVHVLNAINLMIDTKKTNKGVGTTSRYHIPGKLCQFDNKINNASVELPFENNLMNWADIVIINAEGSIVRGTDKYGLYRIGGLYCLFMSYWAKKLNKKCFVVNHTVDPGNKDIFDMISIIYKELDGIIVREPISKNILYKLNIKNNVEYAPDALFTYVPPKQFKPNDYVKSVIDFSRPYICIGDSSALKADGLSVKWNIKKVYKELIDKLKKQYSQIVFIDGFSGKNEDILSVIRDNNLYSISLENADYHNLYYVLSKSDIFISGRWHSSILALLGQTPILLWGSDSHKTEALYEMIEYPYKFFDIKTLPINIDDLVAETRHVISSDNSVYFHKVEKLTQTAYNNVPVNVFHDAEYSS